MDIEYVDDRFAEKDAGASMTSQYPRVLRGKNKLENLAKAQAIQEYYYLAFHFLNEYKFETDMERFIWEQHTDGVSYRNIGKMLASKGTKISKNTVNKIVNKLETLMKQKYLIA